MEDFQDNVAVITGAASGIGKAIAGYCLEQGMSVVLADINKDKLKDVSDHLTRNSSAPIIPVVTNVANENDIQHLAETAVSNFGKVNFLFNNAGIAGGLGPIWEQSSSTVADVIQVNLFGTIFGIKAFVPIMLKQKEQCFIINTSAGAGFLAGKGLSPYKASKHAIIAISEVLYNDLKEINSTIEVSVLIPHWVNTQMPSSIKETDQNIINSHLEHLEKYGICPRDVAKKVFLGIKQKQFYIFTDPHEHLPKIKQRMENILNIQQPV